MTITCLLCVRANSHVSEAETDIKCHLKLTDDKVQPVELTELLRHHYQPSICYILLRESACRSRPVSLNLFPPHLLHDLCALWTKRIYWDLRCCIKHFSLSFQSTGLVSMWNQVPNWKVALPPFTCATTSWLSPKACLLWSVATGSCQHYVDMALCQMALCLKAALAVATVSNSWRDLQWAATNYQL